MNSCVEFVQTLIDEMACDIIDESGIDIGRFKSELALHGYCLSSINYSQSFGGWVAVADIGQRKFVITCNWLEEVPKIEVH